MQHFQIPPELMSRKMLCNEKDVISVVTSVGQRKNPGQE